MKSIINILIFIMLMCGLCFGENIIDIDPDLPGGVIVQPEGPSGDVGPPIHIPDPTESEPKPVPESEPKPDFDFE